MRSHFSGGVWLIATLLLPRKCAAQRIRGVRAINEAPMLKKLFTARGGGTHRVLNSCEDDDSWVWTSRTNKVRDCKWVSRRTSRRCRSTLIGSGGRSSLEACPSCNTDCPAELRCENNSAWVWVNRSGKKRDCEWAAKKANKFCRRNRIGTGGQSPLEACPIACGTCPSRSPTKALSQAPTSPSGTEEPTVTASPTKMPSQAPSALPSSELSEIPSQDPTVSAPPTVDAAELIVSRLSFQNFKDNVKSLSLFGDRTQGSRSYYNAAAWVKGELKKYGYQVLEHRWYYGSRDVNGSRYRTNMYVTKVGKNQPESMYIISAHLDGRGGGGAANDDGSGSSLVLEIARVFGMADVQTDFSVRMIFWNAEETGLNGAYAYVADRRNLQGKENPNGSGEYPEPSWLGMVTHDQILFDHGTPAKSLQSPNADSDIEYRSDTDYETGSKNFANLLKSGNEQFAIKYPAEVSNQMCCTDSYAFRDYCPAVSIRENRRIAEMENGSAPHWHQTTDKWDTYSEDDYMFGFDIVRTTTGTISQLAGVEFNPNIFIRHQS